MSDRRTDPAFLLEQQYRTAENLRARIECHERFSTSSASWPDWVFSHYDFGDGADVLEVGCGDGSMWAKSGDRVSDGWRLTLTDLSPGMVDSARATLGDRATYAVADVQQLPFADESFDGAIANHVLFHVPDRQRALAELARVLRPGGVLVGTTIGADHMRELRATLSGQESVIWSESRNRFGLETAREQLERVFIDVEIELFPDSLEVTEVEPFLAFVRSLDTPGLTEDHLEQIRETVAREIDERGAFHVSKASGRFHCRKP